MGSSWALMGLQRWVPFLVVGLLWPLQNRAMSHVTLSPNAHWPHIRIRPFAVLFGSINIEYLLYAKTWGGYQEFKDE